MHVSEYLVSYQPHIELLTKLVNCKEFKRILKLQSNASLMVESQALRQADVSDIRVEELFQSFSSYTKWATI